MRLVPATSASSRREGEKKRAAKTALPPGRVKSPSSRSVADPVTDLVPNNSPEDAKQYGAPEVQVTLLNQYASGQEYSRARERNAHGPEHHSEEDDHVPVALDQRVEFLHGIGSIGTTVAFGCSQSWRTSTTPRVPTTLFG